MTRVPAWLRTTARPVFEARASFAQLRASAGSPDEMAERVAARQVQEVHAERVRRRVADFLMFVMNRTVVVNDDGSQQIQLSEDPVVMTVADHLAAYGAHLLMSRTSIERSTTIRQYLVEAARPWPEALERGLAAEFLAGLETVSPALPEAAGVQLERRVMFSNLMNVISDLVDEEDATGLLLIAGLTAGLRLRETMRKLITDSGLVVVAADGTVTFSEKAEAKTNARGAKMIPPRCGWRMTSAASLMQNLELPLRLTEQEGLRTAAALAERLRASGVVSDVRAFRRVLGAGIVAQVEARGETAERALVMARHALGHRPGSTATLRYAGGAMGHVQQASLDAARQATWESERTRRTE